MSVKAIGSEEQRTGLPSLHRIIAVTLHHSNGRIIYFNNARKLVLLWLQEFSTSSLFSTEMFSLAYKITPEFGMPDIRLTHALHINPNIRAFIFKK